MLTEADMRALEDQIPALAQQATRRAFEATLRAGLPARVCRGAFIVDVFPDGSERVVKPARPWIPVQPGTRLQLR